MTICVIHPTISKESAEELAKALGWDVCNPFKEDKRDFRNYAGVFNYGCNRKIVANNVINKSVSVATCINKVATYEAFKKAGIPTVNYVTRKQDVPKQWEIVVIRDKVDGARAEGLDYHYQDKAYVEYVEGKPVPDGKLFSEYFEHTEELRVMVFCGKCVGVYEKVRRDGAGWEFIAVWNHNHIRAQAEQAAKALDIDFVGFDVLVNVNEGKWLFLEANTGCILTPEMIDAIKAYL
jgi:glutathione synthase/RimK-type ligase-like ATP-grasp enzyme